MAVKRKAGVLWHAPSFDHPKFGACAVLPKGQWTFETAGKRKEAHVYFHVLQQHPIGGGASVPLVTKINGG